MSTVAPPGAARLTNEQLIEAYRVMRTIREFEERVHREFATGSGRREHRSSRLPRIPA